MMQVLYYGNSISYICGNKTFYDRECKSKIYNTYEKFSILKKRKDEELNNNIFNNNNYEDIYELELIAYDTYHYDTYGNFTYVETKIWFNSSDHKQFEFRQIQMLNLPMRLKELKI